MKGNAFGMLQKLLDLKLFRLRRVRVLLIFFAFLWIAVVIGMIRPNRVYSFEGKHCFAEGAPQEVRLYEGISLRPGVYYAELEYQTDTDLAAWCTLEDGTVFPGGLCTNGEHLYSALDKTGFHVWLYETADAMSVRLLYDGKGELATGNLTITETDHLWRMLLAVTVLLWLLVMGCIAYAEYDRRYGVDKSVKHVFFFVTLIAFLASLPALCGFNIGGADLTYHLQRIEGVKDGLLSGQFPVRLEPEWVYGHGYADAIFYCNALLLFPAILRLLGFTVTFSYNVYCIGMNLATAWISWYCFSKIFKDKNIGIACSALYTLSFVRIYKAVITGAVGEGSAITFIPLVIYGLYRIFAEDPKGERYRSSWLPVAFGYAGLIQTHVLTCEITAFLTIVVCLICIRKVFVKNTFLELAKGAAAAFGLSAWYLVPFLDYYLTQDVHIRHVSGRTIQDRGLFPAQLFYQFWGITSRGAKGSGGMTDADTVGIGFVLMLVLAVFLAMWFCGTFRQKTDGMTRLAKLSAVLGSMLLLMTLRDFPWDFIHALHPAAATLVSSLQFPNRFLGWALAFLVVVYGFCLTYFKERNQTIYLAGIGLAVLSVLTGSLGLTEEVTERSRLTIYNEEGMGFGYISGAEYLLEGTDQEKLTFEHPLPAKGVELLAYEKRYLRVRAECANKAPGESFIEFPILFYKGYEAKDAEGARLSVCPGSNQNLRVMLPENFEGGLSVRFVSPWYWRVGELVTIVTVCGVGIRCFGKRGRAG